jgi:hypothetical protein
MSLFSRIRDWLRPRSKKRRLLPSARIDGAALLADREAPAAPTANSLRSAIRKGFNSTQPVTSVRYLHGRDEQLGLLVEGVLDRYKHAFIYGQRGSGKTSLARVFANIADDRGFVVLYSACEAGQDFDGLMRPYLSAIHERLQAQALPDTPLTVRDVVEILSNQSRHKLIFILDEFDRVLDMSVQHEVARLMKMLSDAAVPVQIVAVGIASGLDALVEGHESLRRHVTAIAVTRIDSSAVFALIERGAAQTGLSFTDASRETIALLSCGSPYHVRLFCALACFDVIRRRERVIDLSATLTGIARAIDDWSLTNARDAALFRHIIASESRLWDSLDMIARSVATDGGIGEDHIHANGGLADAAAMLAEALTRAKGQNGYLVFRDNLAPQFLSAMLFGARNDNHVDHKIVNIAEQHRLPVAR